MFPQEFIRFLAIDDKLKSAFLETHGDMLTADYWRDIKQLHLTNSAPEVAPYYRLGTRRGAV
ncbi:MAG: bifunctional isocitrate dehydrogenase kinase/phosphatase [Proteobacteria bacterium]|nr:bifunctional isocitrate dehydrogenase kinase/phosphatase [Pseudomonadota bacterium]